MRKDDIFSHAEHHRAKRARRELLSPEEVKDMLALREKVLAFHEKKQSTGNTSDLT